MKNLLVCIIVATILNNAMLVADTCEDSDAQLIAQCGAYVKSLETRISDRDNSINHLMAQHDKDAATISKDASQMNPYIAFLIGAGVAFSVYGFFSIVSKGKR